MSTPKYKTGIKGYRIGFSVGLLLGIGISLMTGLGWSVPLFFALFGGAAGFQLKTRENG